MSGEVLAWVSVWSKVQIICIWSSWCHCHPIISCSSEIQNGLPFWCRLTQVVLEKRPLNGCSSSSSFIENVCGFVHGLPLILESPSKSTGTFVDCAVVESDCSPWHSSKTPRKSWKIPRIYFGSCRKFLQDLKSYCNLFYLVDFHLKLLWLHATFDMPIVC